MFVQESDEKIKGLIQLRNPLKVVLVASEKKSFALSLYRYSKRITLPLPKGLVVETKETLDHYRKLQFISEAFGRIDEIYEDKITKKEKEENANAVEFLVYDVSHYNTFVSESLAKTEFDVTYEIKANLSFSLRRLKREIADTDLIIVNLLRNHPLLSVEDSISSNTYFYASIIH
jgi:hypothetical protein